MPGPLLVPLLTAGLQMAGQGANMWFQSNQNKKQKEFILQQYERERQDRLKDWDKVNEYNSPVAQMQRLRDAKLNPNLVYGTGSAQAQAGSIDESSMDSWRPSAPQVDFGGVNNSLLSMYDIQLKEAQINNLEAVNTNLAIEGLLKTAQTHQVETGTKKTQFDLDMAQELKETSMEMARQLLKTNQTEQKIMLEKNEREAAMNASNLQEAIERIITMRQGRKLTQQQEENIRQDTMLKKDDLRLRKEGIYPGSPWWLKMVETWVNKFMKKEKSNAPHSAPGKKSTPAERKRYDSLLKDWSGY